MQGPTAVRRIQVTEGLRWRALRLRALADTPIAFADTIEQARRRPDTQWQEVVAEMATGCQNALFIAERDDEWVGVAGGFADDEDTTTIFTVFIAPAARGEGLLEELVKVVSAWSQACGRVILTLEVAEQNPRAMAAYRRLGFTETGKSRPHPIYPEVTEVEMTRPAATDDADFMIEVP